MQGVPTATAQETVIALCAMLLITLLCRWVFTPSHTQVRRKPAPDFGLLVTVHHARSEEDAVMLRDHLVTEGVRAAVTDAHEVLVFAHDEEKARALIG